MAIPSRNAQPTHIQLHERTFFVTTSTAGRRNILQSERMASLLTAVLQHYRRERKYSLHEFVVMPDHIHLLMTVHMTTIEKAVQFVKGGFSFRAKKELGCIREIWRAGFSEVRIRSVEEYEARRRYIHDNPVKRGLASSAAAFQWSSAHEGYQLDGLPENLWG